MNYNRYEHSSMDKYNRKGLSYFILRHPSDKLIIPFIESIQGKDILEVGLGYGYYTSIMLKNKCRIVGADINPDMGKHLGIPIIKTTANNLKKNIDGDFEYIISIFMTEYLPKNELEKFLIESVSLMRNNGTFITTIILKRGWGYLYTKLANLKGIEKFSYTMKEIVEMTEKTNKKYTIIPINGVFGVPFAVLLKISESHE